MEDKFELSELSANLLLRAYTYYNRERFWKYNFNEWLLKEFTPVRDKYGKVVDLRRTYNGKYGPESKYIGDQMYSYEFARLYDAAIKNENFI